MSNKVVEIAFIILQILLPKHALSRLIARLGNSEIRWVKNTLIHLAIDAFNINLEEAESADANDYTCFNDFFMRRLKADARPLDKNPACIASPCDGKVSQLGDIEKNSLLQAKGKYFLLKDLLGGDEELARQFINGSFATIYLSPRDYHRVHMPCDGTLVKSIYVPGELFSVNQSTAQHIDRLFARNERLINVFETEHGPMISIMVGAMLVAGIETVWAGQVVPPKTALETFSSTQQEPICLEKGAEMGRFKFGSTVILLFPKQCIRWDKEMQAGTEVQMGKAIAEYLK